MGKTNPLNEKYLEEFIELQKKFKDSDLSWSVDASKINQKTWDLSVKNPNGNDEVIHRSPGEIISEIEALDSENQAILQRIKDLL
jgi:type I restriction enzyme M protein